MSTKGIEDSRRISPGGKLILPAQLAARWLFGTDYIYMAPLDNGGVLMTSEGGEWPIVQHYYPESRLVHRVESRTTGMNGFRVPVRSRPSENRLFKPVKVNTRETNLLMPADIINSWGMRRGGGIRMTDLGSSVFVKPLDSEVDIERSVPVNFLTRVSPERQDMSRRLYPSFAEAYSRWVYERGQVIQQAIADGGVIRGSAPKADGTFLSDRVGLFVQCDLMRAATRQAEELCRP